MNEDLPIETARVSAFEKLARFISKEMRMSHVYQPVMLMVLLRNQGTANVSKIARALLSEDRSQVDYYKIIVQRMPGRVLTKNRKITEKDRDEYRLKGFSELSESEIQQLSGLCQQRVDDYIERRGRRIWEHRWRPADYISGTVRYDVLKRAKYRCLLCGVSASDKAIHVDHIVPRNHGGSDDPVNLQALCSSCNSMKRDRDDTDFRGIADQYAYREAGCLFCEPSDDRVIAHNKLALVIGDYAGTAEQHTLIVPRRHVASYFDLFQPELNAVNQLLKSQHATIRDSDSSVQSFLVGVDEATEAGQRATHCHIRLMPQCRGDTVEL